MSTGRVVLRASRVDGRGPGDAAPSGGRHPPEELLRAIRDSTTSGEVGEIVARAWSRAAAGARTDGSAGEGLDRVLAHLGDIDRAARERRQRQHRLVVEVLRDLAVHGTTRALLDGASEALRQLGFEVSEIEWLEGDARVVNGGSSGAGPADRGRRRGSVEAEVVRRRAPVFVAGVRGARAAQSRDLGVAAPVLAGPTVVGVLHARGGHPLDETDRQIVGTFADGLGHLIRWVRLHEELAVLRTGLTDVVERTTRPEQLRGAGTSQPGEFATRSQAGRVSQGLVPPLTRREVETLGHLAAGDTNARIARRLGISEGTVKSHVRSLLRKLGAANRAEAVSMWHRARQRHDHRRS